MEAITVNRYVQVICPVCKAQNTVRIPKSVINQASQLTTVSVPKGEICPHHFQLFIDKNFAIRGYQKVDFQLSHDEADKQDKFDSKNHFVNSLDLYHSNVLDKNKPKAKPKKPDIDQVKKFVDIHTRTKSKMTLNEIYDEFWEFIDDNNEIFRKFMINNRKRRALLKMRNTT